MTKTILSFAAIFFFLINVKCFTADLNLLDTTINFENQNKLIILTTNPDSSEYWTNHARYPNPFGPTMEAYSAIVILSESSFVKISLKDYNGEFIKTFNWESVERGVYKFRWWEYYENIPSGVYYLLVTTKFITTIDKVIMVR